MVSEPFKPPTTGRLTISVWLRGGSARPPPFRVALVGKHEGSDFVRFAQLSGGPNQAQPAYFGGMGSKPIAVLVNDLPLEGLSQLQLRFDLLGPGSLDRRRQLCSVAFHEKVEAPAQTDRPGRRPIAAATWATA